MAYHPWLIHVPQRAFYNLAAWYNFLPFPVMLSQPLAWPFPTPLQGWPGVPIPTLPATNPPIFASDGEDNEDAEDSDHSGDSDEIHLLSEEEANQFRDSALFDPTVKDDSSWQPPEIMRKYLEANFDRNLSEEECKNIFSDFPAP